MTKSSFIACTAAVVALSFASAVSAAGWEDDSTVPAQMPGGAPATQRRQYSARPAPAPAPRAPAEQVASSSLGSVPADIFSQHLDVPVDPSYWLTLAYFTAGGVENAGDLAFCEIDGLWDLAFFRDVCAGDIDLKLRMHNLFFTDDGGIGATPDCLLGLAADAGWTWRFLDGGSIEARIAPGIYSSLDALGGGMFSFPFRAAYYRVISSETSFMAGAEIRPGWDMVFMPLLGLAWQPIDEFRLDLAIPRTRAYLYAWRFTAFAGFEWRSFTYNMKGGDDPDEITVEDILLSVGARFRITDEFHVGAELGKAVNRSLGFEQKDKNADLDVDSSAFVRFFIGGPF